MLEFFAVYNRIYETLLITLVHSLRIHPGSAVVREPVDELGDLLGVLRDDKESILSIPLIHRINDLRGYKLEYYRVERLIPSEEEAVAHENEYVKEQDVVPCLYLELLREIDRDKIRASTRRPGIKTQRHRNAVYKAAEDAYEKNIGSDLEDRYKVRKERHDRDRDAGVNGKPLAYLSKAQNDREDVKENIDRTVRDADAEEPAEDILDKDRKAREAARQKVARSYE